MNYKLTVMALFLFVFGLVLFNNFANIVVVYYNTSAGATAGIGAGSVLLGFTVFEFLVAFGTVGGLLLLIDQAQIRIRLISIIIVAIFVILLVAYIAEGLPISYA